MARALRVDRGDFIELLSDTRPGDDRFYLSSVGPEDNVAWEAIEYFAADGFDTAGIRAARATGRRLCWVRSYLNNKAGGPYVGHAAVVRSVPGTAHLLFCRVTVGVPDTVFLDLCLQAAHAASWEGARRVRTNLDEPVLDILGFRQDNDGRELTTDFLQVNDDAYRQLLTESRRWHPPRSMRRRRSGFSSRVGILPHAPH